MGDPHRSSQTQVLRRTWQVFARSTDRSDVVLGLPGAGGRRKGGGRELKPVEAWNLLRLFQAKIKQTTVSALGWNPTPLSSLSLLETFCFRDRLRYFNKDGTRRQIPTGTEERVFGFEAVRKTIHDVKSRHRKLRTSTCTLKLTVIFGTFEDLMTRTGCT